ncbi:aminomethyl-transferring glycine dehydrogenase subunit GcvPB [Parvularcula sp. LCG005]|uniref:aminomethyl-transferring glycine dehydrogenase subunit GcvPB n=1 Tax=Parvularcula sp. LCG005 TaxID=3078805 RepID=UPI002943E192|nr:aminomethyl-transferring glycine dehydrogenase subunit GcvPB [Parvularcula sp. LCG005]WOI53694.1 aminomethyl-transferring glycine dehydrogenase subunit GcvPB [Parvularcula sp. LCG005]
MTMNNQGRPTRPEQTADVLPQTHTGNRALQIEEPLIFEVGDFRGTGVDFPEAEGVPSRLGDFAADDAPALPGLAEPEAMRHFVRLSQKNYAIDTGLFPLGSCTMKHNPRLNEKMARLPGFADVHPLQPQSTVQGAIDVIERVGDWLKELTGMPAVAMSPKAGAHGELCGMMAIKAALIARGEADTRTRVLAPDSAHGTNPATAAQCGFTVDGIPADKTGRVDLEAFKAKLGPDVAAIMVTNPNTCGLFERDIRQLADLVHEAGGYFYCDGANFNAIMAKARPGDLGVDAMHINLHKTFSTPHGGGGPGSGPTVLSDALAPYAPIPFVIHREGRFTLVEDKSDPAAKDSFGRMVAFHGQMGMFVRALTYMLSHGGDGLRQAAEDAVLNANYIQARLKTEMTPAFDGTCMHEALFDDRFLKDTGVGTLDFAKAMIDEGFHPMTMYFPLVVSGAMLIEPTETESKQSIDQFCDALLGLAREAKAGNAEKFKAAPVYAPRRRLDETAAARKPVLKWTAPVDASMAAE